MTGYSEEIPRSLRLIMVFIDRVGFPVMAFLMMFYMSTVSLERQTTALQANTKAITELSVNSLAFHDQVKADHARMDEDFKRVMLKRNNGRGS